MDVVIGPRTVLLALLALLAASRAAPAEPPTPTEVAETIAAASTYDWGASRTPLLAVERLVVLGTTDPDVGAAVETGLIGLLGSADATRAARDFACRQLVVAGTGRSVPALAALLDDEALSDPARRALEAIPDPAAWAALAEAASTLSGVRRQAAAHSLARRERAVERLAGTGGATDVPLLLGLAEAGSVAARRTLERTNAPGVDAALATAARHGDEATARRAALLLGVRGATARRGVLELLTRVARSPSVRCAAWLALADIDGWTADVDRPALLVRAMEQARTADDERAVLDAVERLGDPALLSLAMERMRTGAARADAAGVVVTLALVLEATDRAAARQCLTAVAEAFGDDPAVLARANEALAHVERNEGYVREWVVAGPYPKDAATDPLIDFAFEPENEPSRSASGVTWQRVPPAALRSPGIVDFNVIFRGNDRCAYGRAVIVSDREVDARLEIGSDDGVKIWLDGVVVHRNDAMRGLTLRQDTAEVRLREGRNVLLVKITQGGGDWQFAVRLRGTDGRALDGVTIAPE
jgi:hypothetical protein